MGWHELAWAGMGWQYLVGANLSTISATYEYYILACPNFSFSAQNSCYARYIMYLVIEMSPAKIERARSTRTPPHAP